MYWNTEFLIDTNNKSIIYAVIKTTHREWNLIYISYTLCVIGLSLCKELILVSSLEINVQIISFNERGSQYVGLFPRQRVARRPLEQALLWGVEVGLDAIKRWSLSVLWIPTHTHTHTHTYTHVKHIQGVTGL